MAGTPSLEIVIKANTLQALDAVKALRSALGGLTTGLSQGAAPSVGGGSVSAGIEKNLVAPLEKAQVDVRKAAEALREQVNNIFAGYEASAEAGGSFSTEGFLRDAKAKIDALRRLAIEGKEGVDKELLGDAEGLYKKRNDLIRAYGVQQSQAEDTAAQKSRKVQEALGDDIVASKKRIIEATLEAGKAEEINNAKISAGARSLRKEQEKFGNEHVAQYKLDIGRQIDKINAQKKNDAEAIKASAALQNDALERIKAAGAKMGSAYNILPGMSPDRIRLITKDVQGVLNLSERIQHEMAKAVALGKEAKIHVVSSMERFNERKASLWSRGEAGRTPSHDIPVTQAEASMMTAYPQMFDKNMAKMIQSRSVIRAFSEDIKSFMSMQVRWFASAGIIFGVIASARAAVVGALEFEKAIKDIGAVTGATEQELSLLSNTIIRVSNESPQSAIELAKLSRVMVQAGLSAEQTSNILGDVAKVATISGEPIEAIGKAFTTAIFAWKMGADEAADIGNTLAATLNFSRVNIEDLATAYNYIASTASQFNLSFSETNSILAVFANLGIRASTMATGFRQVLAEIVAPSDEFRSAMEATGRSYADFVGILEDDKPHKFARVVQAMADAGLKASDAYRLFEKRTAGLVAGALNAAPAAFERMSIAIRESKQLTEGFKTAMESTSNQLGVFKNRLTATAISVFKFIQPILDLALGALKILGSTLISVSKGIETFGNWAFWGALAIGALIYAAVSFGMAWTSVTAIVAASKAIFVGHPVFMIATIAVSLLALTGYLRGASANQKEFASSLEDISKGAKIFAEQNKEMNKVMEEGAGGAQKVRVEIEKLKELMSLPAPSKFFVKWQEDAVKLTISAGAVTERLEFMIKTVSDSMKQMKITGRPSGFIEGFNYDKQMANFERMIVGYKKRLAEAQKVGEDSAKAFLSGSNKAANLAAVEVLNEIERAAQSATFDLGLANEQLRNIRAGFIKAFNEQKKELGVNFSMEAFLREYGGDVSKLFASEYNAIKQHKKSLSDMAKSWKDYFRDVQRAVEDNSIKDPIEKVWLEGRRTLESELDKFNDLKISELGLKQGMSREEVERLYKPAFDAIRSGFESAAKGDPVSLESIIGSINFKNIDRKGLEGLIKATLATITGTKLKALVVPLDLELESLNIQKGIYEAAGSYEDLYRIKAKILDAENELGNNKAREAGATDALIEKNNELNAVQKKGLQIELEAKRRDSLREISLLLGENVDQETEWLEITKKINDALLAGVITQERALALVDKLHGRMFNGEGAWDGFLAGLENALGRVKTVFEQMEEFGKGFAQSLKSALSDYLFDFISGQIEDIDTYVHSFLKGIARAFSDMYAEMVAQMLRMAIIAGVKSIVAGMAGGDLKSTNAQTGLPADVSAFHSGGYIPRYHTGTLSPDERLAILQTGEGVLSRRGVKNLGRLNSGESQASGQGQAAPTIININTLDPQSWREYVRKNPGPVIEAFNNDMRMSGSSRSSVRSYS